MIIKIFEVSVTYKSLIITDSVVKQLLPIMDSYHKLIVMIKIL